MAWRENLEVGLLRARELYLGTTNGQMGTKLLASAALLNQVANPASRVQSITTATYNVEITDHGKIFTLNRAGGIAITLPTVATSAGCKWSFVIATLFTSDGTIVTDSSENKMQGIVVTGADGTATTTAVAADTITFTAAADVLGDRVDIESDGSAFFFKAYCAAANGIVGSQAS
jgi:hypothetical protein